jgi:hypothetical protein
MTQTSETLTPGTPEFKAAKAALPALPTIAALDVLRSQAWKPSADERAALKAWGDWFEALDMSREVHLKVVDVYTGVKIGEIIFNA